MVRWSVLLMNKIWNVNLNQHWIKSQSNLDLDPGKFCESLFQWIVWNFLSTGDWHVIFHYLLWGYKLYLQCCCSWIIESVAAYCTEAWSSAFTPFTPHSLPPYATHTTHTHTHKHTHTQAERDRAQAFPQPLIVEFPAQGHPPFKFLFTIHFPTRMPGLSINIELMWSTYSPLSVKSSIEWVLYGAQAHNKPMGGFARLWGVLQSFIVFSFSLLKRLHLSVLFVSLSPFSLWNGPVVSLQYCNCETHINK
jgi:hypothetical protein